MRLTLIGLLNPLACSEPLNPNDWWKADDPVAYTKKVTESARNGNQIMMQAIGTMRGRSSPLSPDDSQKLKLACIAIVQAHDLDFSVRDAAYGVLLDRFHADTDWPNTLMPPQNINCESNAQRNITGDYYIECNIKSAQERKNTPIP